MHTYIQFLFNLTRKYLPPNVWTVVYIYYESLFVPVQGHSLWWALSFFFFFFSFFSFCSLSSSASYIISWIRYFSLRILSRRSLGRSGIRYAIRVLMAKTICCKNGVCQHKSQGLNSSVKQIKYSTNTDWWLLPVSRRQLINRNLSGSFKKESVSFKKIHMNKEIASSHLVRN